MNWSAFPADASDLGPTARPGRTLHFERHAAIQGR